jgi:hypothetical protein
MPILFALALWSNHGEASSAHVSPHSGLLPRSGTNAKRVSQLLERLLHSGVENGTPVTVFARYA